MTAIVALEHNGKIYMGGDSAGVGGYHIQIRKDPKVFINGKCIIGFTSSFRMGDLLRYKFKVPDLNKKGLDVYMRTTFIDAIRKCFKKGDYAYVNNNAEQGGTFLVGIRGRIFEVDCDFQVGDPAANFAAAGCGRDMIYGSLFTSKHFNPQLSPDTRVRLALQAAERYSAGVRGPFTILSH